MNILEYFFGGEQVEEEALEEHLKRQKQRPKIHPHKTPVNDL